MSRYLFSSHDGFGVGHVRRNTLIARAVLAREPDAQIGIVTGLPVRPSWLGDARMHVIHVPGLVKDSRLLPAGAVENAGIRLDGHLRAARAVCALAGVMVR